MQMNHLAFARSPSLRVSLKRGLARQALSEAGAVPIDMARLIALASDFRPNRKALDRLGGRIGRLPGVVRVRLCPDPLRLVVVTRAPHGVVTCHAGVEQFREESLLYVRMEVGIEAGRVMFGFTALSYCLHAIERLVERTDLPLHQPLLPVLDAEACAGFADLMAGRELTEAEATFLPAQAEGVWVVSSDWMAFDTDWGLTCLEPRGIPMHSIRTFLAPEQMRPTLWLRWRDNPTCRMAQG
ncbi:hypothetical protein [Rhodobacter capsulatus]|jgi:hypothetical protein|uniref:Uncharacterized protein n=1 Tax=Rhodobacter capsulatus (strain ATCC BAA-309 / NBRC 16581 / SB1003) TaxID=272942 RepID=D5ASF2_RHOCB|nr:hypothetical protein [Rhodobacter capsulatus]ADE85043.1 hypothetical protein RCAP_rcc01288 [Rhodobacter capsulatus SB 1003]ETD02169.1 hypothetical protein U714_07660 [Rhodobacter capsulatus DE442]ETD77859.1 hypothetical protein U717_07835 [Rhodobacter capsulatus R121]ETE54202.1 hypothetical protein U715_07835 [Rhodobacter capsulatus Y262]MDS0926697.1 hypothetical protein [Rhodobacter capsulatus]